MFDSPVHRTVPDPDSRSGRNSCSSSCRGRSCGAVGTAVGSGSSCVPDALGELRDTTRSVVETWIAEDRLAGCTESELTAALEQLESTRRAVDAARARAAAELDRRRATATSTASTSTAATSTASTATGGLRVQGWLGWQLGLARAEATGLVRSGRLIAGHPVLNRALRCGDLSLDHVRHIDRCCTPRNAHVLPAVAEQLVELARGVRFETWARDVRMLLALADPDGGHRPTVDDNRLSATSDGTGGVHLRGELVGEWAAEFRAALEAEADRMFRTATRDAEQTGGATARPARAQLLALALVELVRRGRHDGRRPGVAPVSDVTIVLTTPPTLPDHILRPDHLLRPDHPPRPERTDAPDGTDAPGTGTASSTGTASGTVPGSGADGRDAAWLQRITAECLSAATLDGHPLHPSTAALLACDASFRVLVETFTGETLALGRSRRLASAAQRRAAIRRYGGCCFPGCDAPASWVELHHTPDWEHGGATDLPHLAPLCRHHHGIVHRSGWGIEPDPDHGFAVTTPDHRRLPCQAHGRIRDPNQRGPNQRGPD